jgi:DNA-binding HxlR family transcriptional regulator
MEEMETQAMTHQDAFERIAEVMGCKWSLLILDLIGKGVNRPGAIERELPGLTATVLHRCLNRMERDGLLVKSVQESPILRAEYAFSDQGRSFVALVDQARLLAYGWKGNQRAGQAD